MTSSAMATMEPNVGQSRKYKSRKERPCDACRKRKICCTREAYEKDCSLCKTRGESCQYVLPPNVRRNRPLANRQSNGNTPAPLLSPGADSASSQNMNGAKKPGMRNDRPQTVEWISQFVGLSGDQDPFVLRHCSFNHLNCYKAPDWACIRIRSDGDVPLHFTVVPDSHLDARPDYYPFCNTEELVKPYGLELLRSYFNVVHTSYPLLDPARFSVTPRPGDPLVAVMYSLAMPFCREVKDYNFQLAAFLHTALPIERRHPRLETIEASLLWLQRHTQIHRAPTTPGLWGEIGSLVGMAHDLGLNVDPSAWNLSPSDFNRRIRLWWGIYIADKWSALGLGRPSYLNDEHINVPMITLDQFPQVGFEGVALGATPAMQFVAMAHLTTILSDLLNTFYSLKAMDRVKCLPPEMILAYMEDFQARLIRVYDEWIRPLYNVNSLLDSRGTVFLAYHTVEITLYRAILRALPMEEGSYATVRSHAKTTMLHVIEFLEKMPVARLRAFWWSPMSRINFAIAGGFMFFLLLTSVDDTDVEFWSQHIEHYRNLLRLQSISFDMTKLASARIDLLAAGMGVDTPQMVEQRLHDGSVGGDAMNANGVNGGAMNGAMNGTGPNGVNGVNGNGMGVNGNGMVVNGNGMSANGVNGVNGVNGTVQPHKVILPGTAEDWIKRQGHENMLFSQPF